MKLNHLKLKDKLIFESFLKRKPHALSSFSFVNIFIWQDFFDFYWTVIEDNLCLFAKDKISCFMYLPPLGSKISKSLIDTCFEIMDKDNLDRNISRIENIEKNCAKNFKRLNLCLKPKDSEYIYKTKNLINLSGNDFKAKRWAYNYFVKNYDFKYTEYKPKFKSACLKLYKTWSQSRKDKIQDSLYQSMLEDNLKVHNCVFSTYKDLGLNGRVVLVGNQVAAYSFGFKLNKDTFCVLLEVCDLSFKGLAQFIFREFSKEMSQFKFINVMDDSGLENIRKAKLSYRPYKLIPSFIAIRKNAE
jgi:hypothetical protein